MLAFPTDPQSPMEYCFTQLAAWLLYILLLCLVVTFCNVLKLYRRSGNRSSVWVLNQEPLKPQETYTANTVWSTDHCDLTSNVNDTRNKLRRANPRFELLAIMVLIAICGLLLLGLPSTSSLQIGLQSIAGFSSQTPSSTGLQEFFQLYQPISLDSSGNHNCDVEMLLMDHVFGASYGAPFVGKRS